MLSTACSRIRCTHHRLEVESPTSCANPTKLYTNKSTYERDDPDRAREGSCTIGGSRAMFVGGAGATGSMDSARSSRGCGCALLRAASRMLARSAMVSVAVEKMGELFFHPIGRTSGKAMSGSLLGGVGNATPNFGMSSIASVIQ
jgi:hypothetical protein